MKKAFKKISRIFRSNSNGNFSISKNEQLSHKDLEKKVVEGTNRAVKEYKETFNILAAYDRK
ncbi:MAG: hypothetical protein HY979_01070 [Candidatus Magasanikbacteria bacterium]|nr:hypothetical protein [Candidatus Magasanikbacteria bacterium]